MSGLWFKCQDCGSNVKIVVQMSELWFGAISGIGLDGLDGSDLCAGLLGCSEMGDKIKKVRFTYWLTLFSLYFLILRTIYFLALFD